MKKRLLSTFLCMCMMMVLIPLAALADDRSYVSTMDLTIEVPQAGMTKQEGAKPAVLSAQTDYGDLVNGGYHMDNSVFAVTVNGVPVRREAAPCTQLIIHRGII